MLTVIEYLRSVRPGTQVYSREPSPLPDAFVRIKRIGGVRRSLVTDRPRVDIHCWGATEKAAEDLMEEVRALVLVMAGKRGTTTVYDVEEVSGPMWLPDSATGHPRYAFAVEFSARGSAL
ncbi:hypothetical protein XF35_01785 [Streptomyces platensis subsp. clarensis]|nr:hypothetical protein [Streptomyces platensis subsp. clarensis]